MHASARQKYYLYTTGIRLRNLEQDVLRRTELSMDLQCDSELRYYHQHNHNHHRHYHNNNNT